MDEYYSLRSALIYLFFLSSMPYQSGEQTNCLWMQETLTISKARLFLKGKGVTGLNNPKLFTSLQGESLESITDQTA